MPVDGEDSGANRLLEMFTDPPIALLIETAYRDCAGRTPTGELIFERRPADKCRRSVQTQEDESRFPGTVGLVFPDVGVTLLLVRGRKERHVLRTSDDTVGVWRPVETCDEFIVLCQIR
jgi:hypothetical protein